MQAREHGNISGNLYILGDIDEAKMHARNYLTIAEKSGNPQDISTAYSLLGNIEMCQHQWDEAVEYFKKAIELNRTVLACVYLGRVYLRKGDYGQAIHSFTEAADMRIEQTGTFCTILGGLERAYVAMGIPYKFTEFCASFREKHPDAAQKFSSLQWYLESAGPTSDFPKLEFADDFDSKALDPSWIWLDEFGDCCYRTSDTDGLEIRAVNGRDLYVPNLSAPRLMREASGDFTVEVCVFPASDDKPQQGGLLVWEDKDNFLRFEKGTHGKYEMRLHGYVDREWQRAGRGLLQAEDNEEVHLRLERSGDQFSAYCSTDGKNWFTCGRMTLPMDDPIQVGIHAIGMIDSTLYCGEYKEGTATVFRNFRIWTK